MKIATKLLVLLLVVVMCFGSLIACGGGDTTTTNAATTTTPSGGTTASSTTSSTQGQGQQTSSSTTASNNPLDDPSIDWTQYQDRVCTFFYAGFYMSTLYIKEEDAGVNKADVATLARLDYFTEKTGITLHGVTQGKRVNYDFLEPLVKANTPEDLPDIFFIDPTDAYAFAFNNNLVCLNDPQTPNMNFDLDCWHQNINDNLSIWGFYYAASGYWDTNNFERAEAMYFDRDALATINPATIDFSVYPELAGYEGENTLYEWVENGEWTWDKLVALAKLFAGPDGTFNGDVAAKNGYQWSGVAGSVAIFDSINLQPFKNDENGVPVFRLDSTDQDKLMWIHDNFLYEGGSKYANYTDNPWNGDRDEAHPNLFGPNHTALFTSDQVGCLQSFAKYSTEATPFRYGILPMPKYDTQQENYYANTESWYTTLACIPTGCMDLEFSTFVLQHFTEMGKYKFHKNIDTVYEAVIEEGLSGRYAGTSDNAENDKKMLQIIMDSTSASFWEMVGGQLNMTVNCKSWGVTMEHGETPNYQGLSDEQESLTRASMYAILIKLGLAEAS